MKFGLFWRLVSFIAIGAVLIFSLLHHTASKISTQLSKLEPQHKVELLGYATDMSGLVKEQEVDSVITLLRTIEAKHRVWSAVIDKNNQIISHRAVPETLKPYIGFQRKLDWPVHKFMGNTLIGVPIEGTNASFVIELPLSMYPTINANYLRFVLTVLLPTVVLVVFCLIIYRYVMRPLHALTDAATKLANKDLDARVLPSVLQQNDEFTVVAKSFNMMAQQLQELVLSQQQMLRNLSHEMRTPITRLELALELARENELGYQELIERLGKDTQVMNHLVEDALNLAWLESNPDIAQDESVNLSILLQSICEDAEFEFPHHHIVFDDRGGEALTSSNQKIISHSVENVLRNALHYSPAETQITVSRYQLQTGDHVIAIKDQGKGVPDIELEAIFTAFYRSDIHRANKKGSGLGLAIAKRQLQAVGGRIRAENAREGGLLVTILLKQENKHG